MEEPGVEMIPSSTLSQLLDSARQGDSDAAQRVWSHVYDEIRRIAQHAVNQEHALHSVQATELAHEAYLRLAGDVQLGFTSRAHLLATVARAIRRLLVDRARARNADKRGGDFARVDLDDVLDRSELDLAELLDLDAALEELEKQHERCARFVEARFFGGMTLEEAAEALGVSGRTAAGDWSFAKAWLRRRLQGGE
jgi:RNA polymerase sigma factor (TIGR02999 family)